MIDLVGRGGALKIINQGRLTFPTYLLFLQFTVFLPMCSRSHSVTILCGNNPSTNIEQVIRSLRMFASSFLTCIFCGNLGFYFFHKNALIIFGICKFLGKSQNFRIFAEVVQFFLKFSFIFVYNVHKDRERILASNFL